MKSKSVKFLTYELLDCSAGVRINLASVRERECLEHAAKIRREGWPCSVCSGADEVRHHNLRLVKQ